MRSYRDVNIWTALPITHSALYQQFQLRLPSGSVAAESALVESDTETKHQTCFGFFLNSNVCLKKISKICKYLFYKFAGLVCQSFIFVQTVFGPRKKKLQIFLWFPILLVK